MTARDVTVCIATADRPDELRRVLGELRDSSRVPAEVRVADASLGDESLIVCSESWTPLVVSHLRCSRMSAACQRNIAAAHVDTPYIAFCDDDIEVPVHALDRLVSTFGQDVDQLTGGVAAVAVGELQVRPSRLVRWYYRLMAGYPHEHYGGRFFGAAINTYPTDARADPELYPTEWLDTRLVLYRTRIFQAVLFPEFDGYSFQEDVNLSWRIGRTHKLYFDRRIRYVHRNAAKSHRENATRLAVMRVAHRWHNASALLRLKPRQLAVKFLISQIFDTAVLLRARPPKWLPELRASWRTWWQLAILQQSALTLVRAAGDWRTRADACRPERDVSRDSKIAATAEAVGRAEVRD